MQQAITRRYKRVIEGESRLPDMVFIDGGKGQLHAAEEAALKNIKNIFGISDGQYENIKAIYFKDLDKYYGILNCTPDCPDQQIKSNYKKLVKDFHPDTIISKGLPEEFIDFATERFREIREAYENIRKERKF